MVVFETGYKYRSFLYPKETVVWETTRLLLTETRVRFDYYIYKKDDRLAASGFTEHAFVNPKGKPCNLEKQYPELWERLSTAVFRKEVRQ